MKNRIFYIVFAALFLMGLLVPNGTMPASAQPPEPEVPGEIDLYREPCVAGKPCQDENGYWYMAGDPKSAQETEDELRAIGDTDDYGYTLSSTTYSWIDAVNSGTNTSLNHSHDQVGPILLPFEFTFYGETYSEVYIAGPGYLTFSDQWVDGQSRMPDSSEPNNIIAPLWAPFYYLGDGGSGQAFYKFGGSIPNRYFLVEYYQMSDDMGGVYTFEVLLYENGDIKFQYQEMNSSDDGWWCAESGIEDALGEDGLNLGVWCGNYPESYTAVMFDYPDPMARVRVTPLYQGDFTYSGEVDEFVFTVTNIGDLGVDTYDMDLMIVPGGTTWTGTLHDPDTGDLLTDTDWDGAIDTGPLAQGESREVLVRVTVPGGVSVGDGVKTLVDVTSSIDISKTKTVTVESTVPAPFTQAYTDASDWQINNDLSWPTMQHEVDVTPEWSNDGHNPAVVETPDHHFVNVWQEWDWADNDVYGYTLNYAVVDYLGQVIQPTTALTTLYGEGDSYTNVYSSSLAVTPDGKVGVLWTRYIRNASDQYNYNVWFAVLNSNDGLVYGPVNLTNNNQWGNWEQGYTYFGQTKIEASADNSFMLAWTQGYSSQHSEDADVYYMMRNSSGAALTGVINMTADVEDADDYSDLSLTSLSGNKYYVFYTRWIRHEEYGFYYLYPKYRVIDSGGGLIKVESDPSLPIPWIEDSIQLTGGNIILVHEDYDYNTDTVYAGYTVLNGSNFNVITSGSLSHPSTPNISVSSLSVTKTPDGKAIITWMDEDQKYLYYALLHSSGTVLSGPVIFNKFEDRASINTDGYAITTNSWQPAAGIDKLAEFRAPLYGAAPGGMANVQMSYANQGTITATNVQLTLTLPAELSYSHDTSGITPTVAGNTVMWDLPELDFADVGHFSVYVEIPSDAVIGTFYDLSLEITSDGGDVDPTNNTDICQVMAAELLFLPIIMR